MHFLQHFNACNEVSDEGVVNTLILPGYNTSKSHSCPTPYEYETRLKIHSMEHGRWHPIHPFLKCKKSHQWKVPARINRLCHLDNCANENLKVTCTIAQKISITYAAAQAGSTKAKKHKKKGVNLTFCGEKWSKKLSICMHDWAKPPKIKSRPPKIYFKVDTVLLKLPPKN